MPRDRIVGHLLRYATASGAPVREGVSVRTIDREPGGFVARTSMGDVRAARVVLCTGAFQRAHRPPVAATLPQGLPQLDVTGFRNEAGLPPGPVLVVGSGQSGAQLAEELREAGRDVVLSCGRAPWAPRRIGDHDLVWWLEASGFLDQPVATLPSPAARLLSNPLASGHGGGHDLHLRTLRAMGVTLVGRFLGAVGSEARFAPDLAASVAWGDDRYRDLRALFARTAAGVGVPPPDMPDPEPFDGLAPEDVSLAGFGAVVFTGGFRPGLPLLAAMAGCVRRSRLPDPAGRRQHRGRRALLRRRPLHAHAQVVDPHRCRRGRGDRRAEDRRTDDHRLTSARSARLGAVADRGARRPSRPDKLHWRDPGGRPTVLSASRRPGGWRCVESSLLPWVWPGWPGPCSLRCRRSRRPADPRGVEARCALG